MLRIVLDDQTLDAVCKTLAAAVAVAIDEASRQSRIVLEASHNGRTLQPEVLADPPDAPASGEVRFTSTDPRALVAMTLDDVASALDRSPEAQFEIARTLQSGQIEIALQQLKATIAQWQMVQQALHQAHLMLQLPACKSGPSLAEHEPLAPTLDSMARELDQVKDALGREDWVLLADLLAYELPPKQAHRAGVLRQCAAALAPLH
jgi:hypothetical protein